MMTRTLEKQISTSLSRSPSVAAWSARAGQFAAAMLVVGLAAPALAAPEVESSASTHAGRADSDDRWLGIGVSAGGGVVAWPMAVTIGGFSITTAATATLIDLGSINLRFYLSDHWSIDLELPVANAALMGASAGATYLGARAYVTFQPGFRRIRFPMGIGVDWAYMDLPGNVLVIATRPSVQLGIELLPERRIGVAGLLRPFIDISHADTANGTSGVAGGGGLSFSLALNLYL